MSTKLGNEFLRIPKLDVAGSNWVIYKDQFLWSVDVQGYLDHLNGTATEPIDPITDCTDSLATARTLTSDEVAATAEWKVLLNTWKCRKTADCGKHI
ncbi:hypothetical protein C0991_008511 [Blastosporella zonata]|nr:hypothetical protein C0991_008511 [Blastosporella zonata]